jgi:hypothetical protein
MVKTTKKVILHPLENRTVIGLVRKTGLSTESAVTVTPDNLSTFNVCPRIVSLSNAGRTARIPVRIWNISSKVLTIPEKANLCNLEEVRVLRDAPLFDVPVNQQDIKQEDETCVFQDENHTTHNIKEEFGVKINEDLLTPDNKAKVYNLFKKWNQIFPKTSLDLGNTDAVRHRIELLNDTPFKEPYRRVPPHLLAEVKEHLQDMLQIGAIRESKSPWSSNVVIVRKKDGTIRFCIDFRRLNQRTKKDAYGIPKVEDTLHLLSGSQFFSKLDLKSGYWQVELQDETSVFHR